MTPKAWVDEQTKAIVFRGDIRPDEVVDLKAVVAEAYHLGLKTGYALTVARYSKA